MKYYLASYIAASVDLSPCFQKQFHYIGIPKLRSNMQWCLLGLGTRHATPQLYDAYCSERGAPEYANRSWRSCRGAAAQPASARAVTLDAAVTFYPA